MERCDGANCGQKLKASKLVTCAGCELRLCGGYCTYHECELCDKVYCNEICGDLLEACEECEEDEQKQSIGPCCRASNGSSYCTDHLDEAEKEIAATKCIMRVAANHLV